LAYYVILYLTESFLYEAIVAIKLLFTKQPK